MIVLTSMRWGWRDPDLMSGSTSGQNSPQRVLYSDKHFKYMQHHLSSRTMWIFWEASQVATKPLVVMDKVVEHHGTRLPWPSWPLQA